MGPILCRSDRYARCHRIFDPLTTQCWTGIRCQECGRGCAGPRSGPVPGAGGRWYRAPSGKHGEPRRGRCDRLQQASGPSVVAIGREGLKLAAGSGAGLLWACSVFQKEPGPPRPRMGGVSLPASPRARACPLALGQPGPALGEGRATPPCPGSNTAPGPARSQGAKGPRMGERGFQRWEDAYRITPQNFQQFYSEAPRLTEEC